MKCFRLPDHDEYGSSCYIQWMACGMKRSGSEPRPAIQRLLILLSLGRMSTRLRMGCHSMTKHKVVLVPFPFDDLSSTKVRPAVCLTDPIGPHRHVVLAFITSRVDDERLTTDLVLDAGHPGFPSTGLRVSSTLQLHRLMTTTTTLIRRELGTLPPVLHADLESCLRKLFGLG